MTQIPDNDAEPISLPLQMISGILVRDESHHAPVVFIMVDNGVFTTQLLPAALQTSAPPLSLALAAHINQ